MVECSGNEGGPADPFVIEWHAAADADGDTLHYTWQIASIASFDDILLELDTGTETQVAPSLQTIIDLVDEASSEVGAEFRCRLRD